MSTVGSNTGSLGTSYRPPSQDAGTQRQPSSDAAHSMICSVREMITCSAWYPGLSCAPQTARETYREEAGLTASSRRFRASRC